MKPIDRAAYLAERSDKPFLSMSRHGGGRRFYFLPWIVLKIGFGRHRRALAREAAQARKAAGNRFWSDLVPGFLRLPFCLLSRRHVPVRIQDRDAVAAVVERRLALAIAGTRMPAASLLAGNRVYRRLDEAERERAARFLADLALPITGMHGDCHVFNFARARDGRFVLLDWEHYDESGSFVFDYLDFHLAARFLGQRLPWTSFLAGLDGGLPVVSALATRLGARPEALWLYYLITKLDILSRRKGGFDRMPKARQTAFLGLLRDALAAVPAARSCDGTGGSSGPETSRDL